MSGDREAKSTADANRAARDLDFEQAHLAYSIIQSLLEHTRVLSDLLALMAQTLDPETTKALTNTPHWQAYLDSRRAMEKTHARVEKFAEVLKHLDGDKEIDRG